MLISLFGSKDEVRLSELKHKFYTKLPDLRNAMYDAVTDAGLFPRNPNSIRQRYVGLGIIALVFSVVVGFFLFVSFGELTIAAILPGIGMGLTALGLLILSNLMPRKTKYGAELAARWRAFKRYLQNIDQYSDLETQKAIWDRWLPYAIAFGIDKEYIRKFEAVQAPAPGWYIPEPTLYGPYRRRYYGEPWAGYPTTGSPPSDNGERGGLGGGLGDVSRGMGTSLSSMSAGLGTMLASAGATMTSQPSNSSSGGGWGGGGFSGGGSFGGGGGGGGSGGFS